ncbi:MAG: helical backbone metal receptor [Bacteroidota bacterium]|nr:helical backbone metal receptor [Bacteroidota bacterium]
MLFTDPSQITFDHTPLRIISLVPSLTELIFDLGLDDEVIGITKFCVHPELTIKDKVKVGGTKNPSIELITDLNPHLIIANKEENRKEDVTKLSLKFPVWLTEIKDQTSIYVFIKQLAELTNTCQLGNDLLTQHSAAVKELKNLSGELPKLRVIYLIWKNPYMVAAGGTYIDEMIRLLGWKNVMDHRSRYPVVSKNEILNLNPDLVFLSSEPYPFRTKDLLDFDTLKATLVDGEAFSWYGSRLIKKIPYFYSLITHIKSML